MNWYLRQGEEYFNSAIYKAYSVRYGDPDFKKDHENMKKYIESLEQTLQYVTLQNFHVQKYVNQINKLLSDYKIEYDKKPVKKTRRLEGQSGIYSK